jgi:hypothetical protein
MKRDAFVKIKQILSAPPYPRWTVTANDADKTGCFCPHTAAVYLASREETLACPY